MDIIFSSLSIGFISIIRDISDWLYVCVIRVIIFWVSFWIVWVFAIIVVALCCGFIVMSFSKVSYSIIVASICSITEGSQPKITSPSAG